METKTPICDLLVEFEFDHRVRAQIMLMDEFLTGLGQKPLSTNIDFEFEKENSGSFSALFSVQSKTNANCATMWLHLYGDHIRLDIDGINELFEWVIKESGEGKEGFLAAAIPIFTGYILIESKGSKRFVQIFDSQGHFVDLRSRNETVHMLTGRHISRNDDYRRLFLPFYDSLGVD